MSDAINTVHISHSVEETESIAMAVAATFRGGECIALHGELGAGKTQFVRGIVRGLNGDVRRVSSPTYVLMNVYPTSGFTVYHLDAYRVSGADDLEAVGFSEFLGDPGAIVIVEWASRVARLLPRDLISVTIDTMDESTRSVRIQSMH